MLTLPEEMGQLNALKILDISQVQPVPFRMLSNQAQRLILFCFTGH